MGIGTVLTVLAVIVLILILWVTLHGYVKTRYRRHVRSPLDWLSVMRSGKWYTAKHIHKQMSRRLMVPLSFSFTSVDFSATKRPSFIQSSLTPLHTAYEHFESLLENGFIEERAVMSGEPGYLIWEYQKTPRGARAYQELVATRKAAELSPKKEKHESSGLSQETLST